MNLLHGRDPIPAVLALTYLTGLAAAALVLHLGPGGWTGILLAVFALDWSAGIVANAARSTRAYYAGLPLSVSVLFVLVHLAEMPLLWWLSAGTGIWAWMQLILTVKLVVFVAGQIELRGRAGGDPAPPRNR